MSRSAASPRAEAVFERWLDRLLEDPAADFSAFAADAEPELRGELERLQREYLDLRALLAAPAVALREGAAFGDFRLVRRLGGGGMGEVWEAEQLSLRRRVALKFLSGAGGFAPEREARLLREAQAGGRISHRGIVAVHGVGEDGGLRWVVQELVPDGRTLADEIAAARELAELPRGWERRAVRVAREVADALAAAHAAGVVHRDVKPSNVLLGPDGEPRVSDFGIARLTEDPALSRTGERPGTPFYMAPEQIEPDGAVDARTDVFALGATLYELLTLERPFRGDSAQQIQQRILREDPADPRKLRRVPAELAAICLKALEKEPRRRYDSMAALRDELDRWLRGEPVRARPPGPLRRAAKWARRHPVWSVAGSVAAVSAVAVTALFVQERTARLASEASLSFFEGLFRVPDPDQRGTSAEVAAAMLDRAGEDLPQHFAAGSPSRVRLALALGRANAAFGRELEALPWLEEAAASATARFGRRHELAMIARNELAIVLEGAGRWAEAGRLYAEVLEDRAAVEGKESETALAVDMNLGILAQKMGDSAASAARLERVYQDMLSALGPEHTLTDTCEANLATVLRDFPDRLERAGELAAEVLQRRRARLPDGHPYVVAAAHNLAVIAELRGDGERAEAAFREAFALAKIRLPEAHPDRLDTQQDLARFLNSAGKQSEAKPLLEETVKLRARAHGAHHPKTLECLRWLGFLHYELQEWDAAEQTFLRVVNAPPELVPADDAERVRCLAGLGVVYGSQGRFEEAERWFRVTWEIEVRKHGPDALETANAAFNLILALGDLERWREARELLEALQAACARNPAVAERFAATAAEMLTELPGDAG